jgi:FKBP-type peptidyl-prolyl cis-trans isomerase FkpA
MDSLLTMEDVKQGTGAVAVRGSIATVHYRGSLFHGPQFTSTHEAEPVRFRIGHHDVIAGLEWGILGMRVGGRRHLVICPEYAYRYVGLPGFMPPFTVVEFEVELLGIENAELAA